jgi:hypothetical protein
MTAAAPTPWAPDELWDEARALASSIALTAGFAAIYVVAAPIVLLGAIAGGPLWAAIVLAREQAMGD